MVEVNRPIATRRKKSLRGSVLWGLAVGASVAFEADATGGCDFSVDGFSGGGSFRVGMTLVCFLCS